jgi:hypothetical protein
MRILKRGATAVATATWEQSHELLFRASLEWLTQGAVTGTKEGIVPLSRVNAAPCQVSADECPLRRDPARPE